MNHSALSRVIKEQGHSLFQWTRFFLGREVVCACRILTVKPSASNVLAVTKKGLEIKRAYNASINPLQGDLPADLLAQLYSPAAEIIIDTSGPH